MMQFSSVQGNQLMSDAIREQQLMFLAFQDDSPISDDILEQQHVQGIQGALRAWQPTKNLGDEKIQLVASKVLRSLKESSSQSPVVEDLCVKAESMDFGGVKGLRAWKEGGIPVIYLSSNVNGYSESRVKASGLNKFVSHERVDSNRIGERV